MGKIDSEAKAALPALALALTEDDDRESAAVVLEKVNIKTEETEDAEFATALPSRMSDKAMYQTFCLLIK